MNEKEGRKDSQQRKMSKVGSSNVLADAPKNQGARRPPSAQKRNNKSAQSTRQTQSRGQSKMHDESNRMNQNISFEHYSHNHYRHEHNDDCPDNTNVIQGPIIRNFPRQNEHLTTQKSGTSLSMSMSGSQKKPPMNPVNFGSSFSQVAR